MRLIDADDKGNITIVFDNEGRGIIKRIDAPTIQAVPIEVLDKIRAEIADKYMTATGEVNTVAKGCLQIIDKYKAESGDKE